jgi:hypothetical protein
MPLTSEEEAELAQRVAWRAPTYTAMLSDAP